LEEYLYSNKHVSKILRFLLYFFVILMGNRSYYRCTNPRCSAKKQVERSREDPETLIITYEGLHLHFAYPYFLHDQNQYVDPAIKKPKKTISQAKAHETQEAHESPANLTTGPVSSPPEDREGIIMGSQGLLEDMVPFMIRNPPNNTFSNSSSCSSYRSPPTSPSSLSWCPSYSATCFDIGI
jgi:hypothetical protein